jgi:hypothetical protein
VSLTLLTKEELEAGQAAYVASLLQPNKRLIQRTPYYRSPGNPTMARISREAGLNRGPGVPYYCFCYVLVEGRLSGFVADAQSDSYAEAFALALRRATDYLSRPGA